MVSFSLPHPSQYKAGRAFFSGKELKVRPAARKASRAFSLAGQITHPFGAARLRLRGKRLRMGSCATCLAPPLRKDLMKVFLIFCLTRASARRVALSFLAGN